MAKRRRGPIICFVVKYQICFVLMKYQYQYQYVEYSMNFSGAERRRLKFCHRFTLGENSSRIWVLCLFVYHLYFYSHLILILIQIALAIPSIYKNCCCWVIVLIEIIVWNKNCWLNIAVLVYLEFVDFFYGTTDVVDIDIVIDWLILITDWFLY